jgi:lipase chaperone LimK
LASDEARAEAELKRIKSERAKLNASKIQLQINLYSKELTDLELEKAKRIAEIETDYLRRKGEIQAKMQVAASVSTGATCTN